MKKSVIIAVGAGTAILSYYLYKNWKSHQTSEEDMSSTRLLLKLRQTYKTALKDGSIMALGANPHVITSNGVRVFSK